MKANMPRLAVLPDQSILASGDQTKSDRYEIVLENLPSDITALRLEAFPDASLPKRGPGRIFYEGPFGDFHLNELTATADGSASGPFPLRGPVVSGSSGLRGHRRRSAVPAGRSPEGRERRITAVFMLTSRSQRSRRSSSRCCRSSTIPAASGGSAFR